MYRRPYLSLPYWGRRIVQEIWNLKSFLYMFSVCLYQKWLFPKYEPKSPVTNTRVLVTSLFYKGSFKKGEYRDPFFGNFHNIIDQNGNSVTYVCSPLGNFKESARKIRECNEVSILVPFSIVTWSKLILLGLKVLIRRFRLPQTDFGGCDFSRLITWNARRCDYVFNLHAEICYAAVKELCKREQFNRLIQLYEGNVFERGARHGG